MVHQCVFPPSTNLVHDIAHCSPNGAYSNICVYDFNFHYVWVRGYVCACITHKGCPGFSVDVLHISSVDREKENS